MANETYRWKGAIEPRSEQYTGQTNFIEYSQGDPEDFTTWVTQNSTTAATTELAPWGEEHVTKFSDDGVGSTSKDVRIEARTMDIGEEDSHIFSVYAKEDQTGVLELRATGFDTTQLTRFDITDQTTGNSSADEFGIEDVGDGWYRCWIRFSTVSDTVGDVYIHLNDTKTTPTCTTDGTHSVFLAGAKVERNHLSPYKKLPETIQPNVLLASTTDNVGDITTAEDFSVTSGWTYTNVGSVTDGGIADPFGGLNASEFVDDNDDADTTFFIKEAITSVTDEVYVASIFAKKTDAADMEGVYFSTSGYTTAQSLVFDLNDGTIDVPGFQPASVYGIEDWGDGWYRCWVQFTASDTAGEIRWYFTQTGGDIGYVQDGTNTGYLYGAKLEVGETPTAYTPLNATYRWKGAQEPVAAVGVVSLTLSDTSQGQTSDTATAHYNYVAFGGAVPAVTRTPGRVIRRPYPLTPPALLTSTVNVTLSETSQGQQSDTLAVTENATVALIETGQSQQSDTSSTTENATTTLLETSQGQQSDTASVSTDNSVALVETSQAQTSDNTSLTEAATVSLVETDQAQASDTASLTEDATVTLQESQQAQTSDTAPVSENATVTLVETSQTQISDPVSTGTVHSVTLTETSQAQASDTATADQTSNVVMLETAQTQSSEEIVPNLPLTLGDTSQAAASGTTAVVLKFPITLTETSQAQDSDDVATSTATPVQMLDTRQLQASGQLAAINPQGLALTGTLQLQQSFSTDAAFSTAKDFIQSEVVKTVWEDIGRNINREKRRLKE